MATYLRRNHPAKKAELLRWRKQELVVKIRKGLKVEELSTSVERVRAAKLAYLKGQRYYILERSIDAPALAKVDAEMKVWQKKSSEAIIEWCKRRG
jgi:NMD protein affecting ribosome stability and mRNA decay